jgi:putative DNA primase/helicase
MAENENVPAWYDDSDDAVQLANSIVSKHRPVTSSSNDGGSETIDESNKRVSATSTGVLSELRAGSFGTPFTPTITADAFEELWLDDDSKLVRRRKWGGKWFDWTKTHWEEIEHDAVKGDVYRVLKVQTYIKVSDKKDESGENKVSVADWNPTRKTVGDVLDAITGTAVFTPKTVEMPSWICDDGDIDGKKMISLKNGVLDMSTLELGNHSPAFFNGWSLSFNYDPNATCPKWDTFLESAWPDDDDSKCLLQEWFGYVLSGRTDLQKFFFINGPTRSGKGTIAHVLSELIGTTNVASPMLGTLCTNFGLASLVNKPLAVISDLRTDRTTDVKLAVQRLLSIVGEDPMYVDRKGIDAINIKLPARIMIASNDALKLGVDESQAITKRRLTLCMTVSNAGKEDWRLKAKLSTELAGIFNWALQGLERLELNDGRFTEPEASREMTEQMNAAAAPVKTFLEEECVFHPDAKVLVSDLYDAYRRWVEAKDEQFRSRKQAINAFGNDVVSAAASIGTQVQRQRIMENGKRQYFYAGVDVVGESRLNPADLLPTM